MVFFYLLMKPVDTNYRYCKNKLTFNHDQLTIIIYNKIGLQFNVLCNGRLMYEH